MELEYRDDCTVTEVDLCDSTALIRVLGPELYAAVNVTLFENVLALQNAAHYGRSRGDALTTLFYATPAEWAETIHLCQEAVRLLDAELRAIVVANPTLLESVAHVFDMNRPLLRLTMGVGVGDAYLPHGPKNEVPEVLILGSAAADAEAQLDLLKHGKATYRFKSDWLPVAISPQAWHHSESPKRRAIKRGIGPKLPAGTIAERLTTQDAKYEDVTVVVAALPDVPPRLHPKTQSQLAQQRAELAGSAYQVVIQELSVQDPSTPIRTDGEMYLVSDRCDVPAIVAKVAERWVAMCDGMTAINLTESQRQLIRQHYSDFAQRPLTKLRLAAVKDTIVRVDEGNFGMCLNRAARWLHQGEQDFVASLETLKPRSHHPTSQVPAHPSITYGAPLTNVLKGVTGGRHSNAVELRATVSAISRHHAWSQWNSAQHPANSALPRVEPIVSRRLR